MYTIQTEYKGIKIQVKAGELYLDGATAPMPLYDARDRLSKQVICQIYADLLGQVAETPKGYYRKLSFDGLVEALNHAAATDKFLREFRMLNVGDGYAREKIGAEVRRALSRAIIDDAVYSDAWYKHEAKFSPCERWVLRMASEHAPDDGRVRDGDWRPHYVGESIADSTLAGLYDPVKDDDGKLRELIRDVEAYPFNRFMDRTRTKELQDTFAGHVAKVQTSIEVFRKMRAIAGDDAVNWGPHKWHSQVKRAGIKSDHTAERWLLRDVCAALAEQGVKPAEKKASSIARLKEKATGDAAAELTQDELVRLFKAASPSACAEYVREMTAATAVSLFGMTTKNVTDKVGTHNDYRKEWDAGPAVSVIVGAVERDSDPESFKTLLKYLRDRNLFNYGTWGLFQKYVGHFSVEDFCDFGLQLRGYTGGESDDKTLSGPLADWILAALPADRYYTVNASVTDLFLRRRATDTDKVQVLENARAEGTERYDISWNLSHDVFTSLPYEHIRALITCERDSRAREHGRTLRDEYVYFLPEVHRNADRETARAILLKSVGGYSDDSDKYYRLFSLFSFDEKATILELTDASNVDLKKAFTAAELASLEKLILTREGFCDYVASFPRKRLNEVVKAAYVIQRLQGKPFYMPLNEELVKHLNAESARLILERAEVSKLGYGSDAETTRAKVKLYAKLTRAQVNEAICGSITAHPDRDALAQHMTAQELTERAERDAEFLRKHIALMPKSFLERYRDKESFKAIVGDRRDRANNAFGAALESRLTG